MNGKYMSRYMFLITMSNLVEGISGQNTLKVYLDNECCPTLIMDILLNEMEGRRAGTRTLFVFPFA